MGTPQSLSSYLQLTSLAHNAVVTHHLHVLGSHSIFSNYLNKNSFKGSYRYSSRKGCRSSRAQACQPSNSHRRQDLHCQLAKFCQNREWLSEQPENKSKVASAIVFVKDELMQLATLMKITALSRTGVNAAKVIIGNFLVLSATCRASRMRQWQPSTRLPQLTSTDLVPCYSNPSAVNYWQRTRRRHVQCRCRTWRLSVVTWAEQVV